MMIVFQIELKNTKAGFYEMKRTADSMKHAFRHLLIDDRIAK